MSEKTSLIEEAIKNSKLLSSMVESNQESTLKRHLIDAFDKKLKESEEKVEKASKNKLPQHSQEEKLRKQNKTEKGSLQEQNIEDEDENTLEPEGEESAETIEMSDEENEMEISDETSEDMPNVETDDELETDDEMDMESATDSAQTIDLTGLDSNLAIKVILNAKDDDEVVIVRDENGEVSLTEAEYKSTIARLIKEGFLDEGDLEIDITHDDHEYETEVEELDETEMAFNEMMKEMEMENEMMEGMQEDAYDSNMSMYEEMSEEEMMEMMKEMEMEEGMMDEDMMSEQTEYEKLRNATVSLANYMINPKMPQARNIIFSLFMFNNGFGRMQDGNVVEPDFKLTLQNLQPWYRENLRMNPSFEDAQMFSAFTKLSKDFEAKFPKEIMLSQEQIDDLMSKGVLKSEEGGVATESTSVGYNNARAQTVKPKNFARKDALRPAVRQMYENYKKAVNENNTLKGKINQYEGVIKEMLSSVKESTLAAANTHYLNLLLLDHEVSETNKIKIMEKFDKSTNVEESKKLYEAINKKLTDKKANLKENLENYAENNEKGKQKINEAKLYQAYINDKENDKETRIKKLMGIE